MVNFIPWVEKNLGLDTNMEAKKGKEEIRILSRGYLREEVLSELKKIISEVSVDDRIKIYHSHGQSLREIYDLRQGQIQKCVDCVVYPET